MMKPSPERTTSELDKFYEVADLFCAAYHKSDYRFGELHFSEQMADGDYPACLIDPPPFMKGGWTRYHEISMILHPEKGALLLRMAQIMEGIPRKQLIREISDTHSALVTLQWKIHHRLEQIGFWNNRPIVLGVGVVTPHRCPDELRPVHLDPVVILDRDKLPELPIHIDALFDYYTSPASLPSNEWGARLITDLTDSPDYIGGFVDEESLLELYEDSGRPLEDVIARPGQAHSDDAAVSPTSG